MLLLSFLEVERVVLGAHEDVVSVVVDMPNQSQAVRVVCTLGAVEGDIQSVDATHVWGNDLREQPVEAAVAEMAQSFVATSLAREVREAATRARTSRARDTRVQRALARLKECP